MPHKRTAGKHSGMTVTIANSDKNLCFGNNWHVTAGWLSTPAILSHYNCIHTSRPIMGGCVGPYQALEVPRQLRDVCSWEYQAKLSHQSHSSGCSPTKRFIHSRAKLTTCNPSSTITQLPLRHKSTLSLWVPSPGTRDQGKWTRVSWSSVRYYSWMEYRRKNTKDSIWYSEGHHVSLLKEINTNKIQGLRALCLFLTIKIQSYII